MVVTIRSFQGVPAAVTAVVREMVEVHGRLNPRSYPSGAYFHRLEVPLNTKVERNDAVAHWGVNRALSARFENRWYTFALIEEIGARREIQSARVEIRGQGPDCGISLWHDQEIRMEM